MLVSSHGHNPPPQHQQEVADTQHCWADDLRHCKQTNFVKRNRLNFGCSAFALHSFGIHVQVIGGCKPYVFVAVPWAGCFNNQLLGVAWAVAARKTNQCSFGPFTRFGCHVYLFKRIQAKPDGSCIGESGDRVCWNHLVEFPVFGQKLVHFV